LVGWIVCRAICLPVILTWLVDSPPGCLSWSETAMSGGTCVRKAACSKAKQGAVMGMHII
jgi:hypothetical protein